MGSFVSRNNDVDGYWALGLLRAEADMAASSEMRLHLLRGSVSPESEVGLQVARLYEQFLLRQSEVRRIARARITDATIVLTFGCDESGMTPYTTYGEPFRCVVVVENDRGRKFQRTIVARCSPHDPRREIRSTRALTPSNPALNATVGRGRPPAR
jgi:hypothetical protein